MNKSVYTDMSLNADERLAAYLLDQNHISEDGLHACRLQVSISNQPLSVAIVENNLVRQDIIINAMMEVMPSNLVHEEKIVQHIPVDVFKKYQFKIAAEGYGKVYISTLSNEIVLQEVLKEYYPDQEIIFVSADPDSIESYIHLVDKIQSSESSTLEKMIRDGIQKGASDIHILQKSRSFSVFYRIDGMTKLDMEGDIKEFMAMSAMIKDRASMDMAERRMPQDGGFDIEYNGRQIALRVASVPLINNCETLILRILDPEKSYINLDKLGITRIDEWSKGASRMSGMNLVCGETGSGKTTTITSSARDLNRFEQVIFTVEDPVEHRTPFFRQININPDIGLTFSKALKAIMRSDPNIIIIGEIRDLETAGIAIQAALTGHLVFATVHTGSILGAIGRFRDLGIELYQLKAVLRSVLVQHLMRLTCSECGNDEDKVSNCTHCLGMGYKGRTVISECHYFRSEEEVETSFLSRKVNWPSILDDAFLKVVEKKSDLKEFVRIFGPEAIEMIENNFNDLHTTGHNPGKYVTVSNTGGNDK